jgi:hypothetical protein
MSVNFHEAKCQQTTNKTRFGLRDDENTKPAYIDFQNESEWNAKVSNPTSKKIAFTAIDHCIKIFRENGEMDSCCDGMLTYSDNVVFVELKNKRGGWKTEGMQQIETSINQYKKSHNLSVIKHKRAFIANKKHPDFCKIEVETRRKFWDKYRVRLNICSEIKI